MRRWDLSGQLANDTDTTLALTSPTGSWQSSSTVRRGSSLFAAITS